MKKPEKNIERFPQTILRTIVTTTLIAIILSVVRVFPYHGMSEPVVIGVIWLMIFCIVFGGHWLEMLFINYIKFVLPSNILLLYLTRIIYWYLSAIPLFILANWVGTSLTNHSMHIGNWQTFGLFYICIELFMHIIMQLRGQKSFYNGVY